MNLLIEILQAISTVLLNPVFYWLIVLIYLPGYRRIQLEYKLFNQTVSPLHAELNNTLKFSLIASSLLFIFTIGTGVSFTHEMILILTVALILLTYKNNYIFLSASYTLGITFILLYIIPDEFMSTFPISQKTYVSITLLIGLMLIAEGFLFHFYKDDEAFSTLSFSKRGRWYGKLQLSKLSIIPFVLFVPDHGTTTIGNFWPQFAFGDVNYTLFIMPFAIGFNHYIKGSLPSVVTKAISKKVFVLAFIVIGLSLLSFLLPIFTFIAACLAIIGRGLIHYFHYKADKKKPPYFFDMVPQVRVLGVVANSHAENLGFQLGDTIIKVKDEVVQSFEHFKQVFDETEGYCKFEVQNATGEIKVIINEQKEESLESFGLIFGTEPVRYVWVRRKKFFPYTAIG